MTRRLSSVLAVALLLATSSIACNRSDDKSDQDGRVTQVKDARRAVSEALMLALGQAKNFHGKADVYVKNGDIDNAIAEVERVLTIRFPGDAPEGEDVALDARARLGKLLLGKGNIERAREVVDQGVKMSTRESFFLANLHTVRGEIIESQAQAIEEDDPQQARKLRMEAIVEFDRSIAINEKLQKKLLGGAGE